MTVFVSRTGGGSEVALTLSPGATVADLLAAVAPDSSPEEFAVRVNRQPTGPDRILWPGDRVAVNRMPTSAND